jgi:predicted phosphodiesterase
VLLVGDVHGRWDELTARLAAARAADQPIVQVGDFGLGFLPQPQEAAALAALDRFLVDRRCQLWVIRGNHDNPARWAHAEADPWRAIHLVPDYTVLRLEGHTLLCVGGAISIDRLARSPGISYWPDEGFRLDAQRLAALDLSGLDMVVTHTAPDDAPPREPGAVVHMYAAADPGLLRELPEERRQISRLRELLLQRAGPRLWVYGHFHAHATSTMGGILYIMLDVHQFYRVARAEG